MSDDYNAEILISRSVISPDEIVSDKGDLKQSIQDVLDEIIPDLPQSKLLTSSGFHDGYRASFVIEFFSLDTTDGSRLRHRFKGILYRHPNGHQLLFTVWGKARAQEYFLHAEAIKLIQDEFRYLGAREEAVFPPHDNIPWYPVVGLFVAVGLLYFFRTYRTRSDKVRFKDGDNIWRCECGRLNHADHGACRRCGRSRLAGKVT
jgi:hypothetical protein